MTKKEMLRQIIKREKPLIDIWHYLVGNYRYWVYYNYMTHATIGEVKMYDWQPLMRKHIFEQINFRIKVMNKECYNSGSCIKCGCNTTQLQMADKPCEGLEYPPMMNKQDWNRFLLGRHVAKYKEYSWIYLTYNKSLTIFQETSAGYIQVNI